MRKRIVSLFIVFILVLGTVIPAFAVTNEHKDASSLPTLKQLLATCEKNNGTYIMNTYLASSAIDGYSQIRLLSKDFYDPNRVMLMFFDYDVSQPFNKNYAVPIKIHSFDKATLKETFSNGFYSYTSNNFRTASVTYKPYASTNFFGFTAYNKSSIEINQSGKGYYWSNTPELFNLNYVVDGIDNLMFVSSSFPIAFNLSILYEDTEGKTMSPSYSTVLNAGTAYKQVSPTIAGYTPDKPVVTGTISNDTEEKVIYSKNKYKLTIKCVDEDGNNLVPDTQQDIEWGSEYTVKAPTVSGYAAKNAEIKGVMGQSDSVETFVYEKVKEALINSNLLTPIVGSVSSSVGSLLVVGLVILSIFLSIRILIRVIKRYTTGV